MQFTIAIRNFEISKILIEKGANVNAENDKKETPLFKGSFLLFQTMDYFINI